MNDWIIDRPPTDAEAVNEIAVLVTTKAGKVASVWTVAVRNDWGEDYPSAPVAWKRFPAPYVPPEPEMPDEIYVGTSDGRFGGEGKWSDRAFPDAILYVRKDIGEKSVEFEWYCGLARCTGCEYGTDMPDDYTFCPGCGGRIKR
jgi:hypothetical protein